MKLFPSGHATHPQWRMAAALALLADRDVSRDTELLDLSQAAPPYPPAPEVVARVVEVARAPDGAAYTGRTPCIRSHMSWLK